MLREERIFYDRSYLKDKGIRLANTDRLSKLIVRFDKVGLLQPPNEYVFELVLGIIQKVGHQHLSYDSMVPMKYEHYRLLEYHFNYLIMTSTRTLTMIYAPLVCRRLLCVCGSSGASVQN